MMRYNLNYLSSTLEIINNLTKVRHLATGFMMIRRRTLEKFQELYPEKLYRPDHVRTEHFDGSREIMAFFDTPIDGKRTNITNELKVFLEQNPQATHEQVLNFVTDPNNGVIKEYTKRYLSEDYMFCQWVRNAGMKVWFCPWMQLQHVGMYVFGGSLVDLAQIGASATADPSQLKKFKN
jgi:cellulose synthase/poly-beta-1,6-N-acetylglucosamine synthase-like glycosyltransferase